MTVKRDTRIKARHTLLERANKIVNSKGVSFRKLYMRNLNEAVCIVRQSGYGATKTGAKLLVNAGFNSARKL